MRDCRIPMGCSLTFSDWNGRSRRPSYATLIFEWNEGGNASHIFSVRSFSDSSKVVSVHVGRWQAYFGIAFSNGVNPLLLLSRVGFGSCQEVDSQGIFRLLTYETILRISHRFINNFCGTIMNVLSSSKSPPGY